MDNIAPIIFFAALWLLERIIKALRKKKSAATGDVDGSVPPGVGYQGYFAIYRQRLAAIEDRTARLIEAIEPLGPTIAERLLVITRDEIQGGARTLVEQIAMLAENADAMPDAKLVAAMQEVARSIATFDALLGVVESMVTQREDHETQALLGDADALAEACYRPVLDFTRDHGIPIESNYPLTVLHRGGIAIHTGFLPYQLAPIALPPEYGSEPWRWPAIAHEVAHDLVASIPGLREEMIAELGIEEGFGGIEATVEGLDYEATPAAEEAADEIESMSRALFQEWVDEIFADAVGTLMIGPAYLRSMVHIFARPESVQQVLAIPVSGEGAIDPHPPRHLRVHMTASFLRRMGYATRGESLRREWDLMHDSPDVMLIVSPEHYQQIPAAWLLEVGDEVVRRLYNAEFQILAGHRLADVPGLEFGTVHATRAERARKQLAAGRPAAFDARSLIAAATEAAIDAPDDRLAIMAAVQRSIVGIGTEERPGRVRAMAAAQAPVSVTTPTGIAPPMQVLRRRARPPRTRRHPVLPLEPGRIVDALILGEVLNTPGGRRTLRAS